MAFSCKCGNICSSTGSRKISDNTFMDALDEENLSGGDTSFSKLARVSSLNKSYQLTLTKVNSDLQNVDAENQIQSVVTCLTSIDCNASLTFVDSFDNDSTDEDDGRPSILANVIYCLYCRNPEFVSCTSSDDPLVSTLYATNYATNGCRGSDYIINKLVERNRSSSADDEMGSQTGMDLIYRLQGLKLAEESEDIVISSDKNNLPASLKVDWSRIRSKLKQSLNEALAEIELAKKCEIQRLIQMESEKAAKRKAEVTGMFSAFEESLSQLPRVTTRHTSSSDQTVSSIYRSGSSKLYGSNRSNQNLSDEGIENDGGEDEPFVLDGSSVDQDDMVDPLMFSSENAGVPSSKVTMNTDFSDEEDDLEEEDTFWTESSGGSSSGIDGNNYNTTTDSKSINMGANRSSAAASAKGYFRNQPGRNSTPSSKPIQIGSVSSHANRSASIALDNDDDQPGENIHERMRELSKSVRLGSSDIFGDLPDDHRRLDIAQLVRSYNSSNHELFMYSRDTEPNF